MQHIDKRERENSRQEILITRIAAIMKRYTDITEASMARSLGVSPTKMNQYRHFIYNVSPTKLEEFNNQIDRYLRREAEHRIFKKEIYVETSIGAEICAALHRCHVRVTMGAITGSPGTGKTMATKHYKSLNPDIILLSASINWNHKSVLTALQKELNLYSYHSPSVAEEQIIDTLYGTDRMIAVDEAQFLEKRSLETLRIIHDNAHVGVVYIGQPELNRRMIGKEQEEYGQLFSRISVRVPLDRPTFEDVAMIVVAKGVDNTPVVEHLYKLAIGRYGSLRSIVHMLDLAIDTANLEKTPVTVKTLQSVNQYMIV